MPARTPPQPERLARALRSTGDPRAGVRAGFILACLGLLAACAEQRTTQPAPGVNLSGYSAEFKQGYADGCASVSGAMKRDSARFEADDRYARGWQDGYSMCKR